MKFYIDLKIKSVRADIRHFVRLVMNVGFWNARVDRHLNHARRLYSHRHLAGHVLFVRLIKDGLCLEILQQVLVERLIVFFVQLNNDTARAEMKHGF